MKCLYKLHNCICLQCDPIDETITYCLCTSSLSTEHRYNFMEMATHAQFSHSPTHDRMMMCNRRILQNCIYFIIITTVMYLWNTPQKCVLSHMHPNMLKIVTSATNAPTFTYPFTYIYILY